MPAEPEPPAGGALAAMYWRAEGIWPELLAAAPAEYAKDLSPGRSTMMVRKIVFFVVVVGFLALTANDGSAQMTAGAVAMQINPSIRADGMGRSSAAVFWGDGPNYWANPALLGYHQGVRFEHARTQLIPEFFNDVYFTNDRLTIGYWGVGLSLIGRPFDALGKTKLDYGNLPIIDGEGSQIGVFNPYEKVRSWGVGISFAELVNHLLELAGHEGIPFSRFADVSVGFARKEYEAELAPALPSLGLTEPLRYKVGARDRGILLRATPYNSIDYPGLFPRFDSVVRRFLGGFRLDVSAAEGSQNYNDPVGTTRGRSLEAFKIAKVVKRGWAFHAAMGFPEELRGRLGEGRLAFLAESLAPLLSFGKAWDGSLPSVLDRGTGERLEESEIEGWGWELTIANIFSIRRGHFAEPDGDVDGSTSGWSLGFQFEDIGGFRYDHATVPQSSALKPLTRNGYAFYVDPVALWRRL